MDLKSNEFILFGSICAWIKSKLQICNNSQCFDHLIIIWCCTFTIDIFAIFPKLANISEANKVRKIVKERI
jgi:hypothetical protein